MGLTLALVALLVAATLAYRGASLRVWTLAIAVLLALLALSKLLVGTALVVSVAVFVAFALLLNVLPLRRALLTRSILAAFRKVLPEMSDTEREAIEAGDVWWEAELFRGAPDWSQLLKFEYTQLTAEEQAFLDNECETLCALCDDWKIEFEDRDLPRAAWDYIAEHRFFAMLIGKEHGGLGFSALAQSAVVTKLATKSITLAVTVMVPNSLGPGELLTHYGTEAQQKRWMPGLVSGREIPCFGLTGPEVGSDATAMPDVGIVGYGEHDGASVLGVSLTFSKRYITLAPVATVIGLAFKLRDPDGLLGDRERVDYGITCALLPANTPGVQIGRRHYPGAAFMNGTIHGREVFVPLDAIIGGPAMAGKGWRMLTECLSAGRGISLPALATASGQVAYRVCGTYGRMRRQFGLPIGRFEGVQEATGRIAGYAYTLEAMRTLTASAVDHCAPAVATAIAKVHMTELMRKLINDGMDVLGGRGIQRGPRNFIATGYQAMPVAITVEGANILTRNLIIYGQGAIRCHRYVYDEMQAAHGNDLVAFDRLLFAHIGSVLRHAARSVLLMLSGGRLARVPGDALAAAYFRQLSRLSAALAFTSDLTMLVVGGKLKFMERQSARLGDVLAQLYIASAVLRFYLAGPRDGIDAAHARWALDHALHAAGTALDDFIRNFPSRGGRWLLRLIVMPRGNPYAAVGDALNAEVAKSLLAASSVRERLGGLLHHGDAQDPLGRVDAAWHVAEACEPAYQKFFKLVRDEALHGSGVAEQLADAAARGLMSASEVGQARRYDEARYDLLLTDDFSKAYLAGDCGAESRDEIAAVGASSRVA